MKVGEVLISISKITLENFEGFKGRQSFQLADFNLIFGQNSTGKTSILRCLNIFFHSLHLDFSLDGEHFLTDNQHDYEKNGFVFDRLTEETLKSIKFSSEPMSATSIEVEFKLSTHSITATDELAKFEGQNIFLESFPSFRIRITDEVKDSMNQSSFSPIDIGGDSPFTIFEKGTIVSEQHSFWVNPPDSLENFSLNDSMLSSEIHLESNFPNFKSDPAALLKQLSHVPEVVFFASVLKYVKTISDELTKLHFHYVNPDRKVDRTENSPIYRVTTDDDTINQVYQDFFSLTDNRYLPLDGVKLSQLKGFEHLEAGGKEREMNFIVDLYTGNLSSYRNVGSGISAMFPVLEALRRPDTRLLHIGEPETHLHPELQGKFARKIYEISQLENKQVIIETHSENMLLAIQKGIRLGKIESSKIAVTYTDVRVESVPVEKEGTVPPLTVSIFKTLVPSDLHTSIGWTRGWNVVRNLELNSDGDLIDPFPESFASMRANYLYGLDDE